MCQIEEQGNVVCIPIFEGESCLYDIDFSVDKICMKGTCVGVRSEDYEMCPEGGCDQTGMSYPTCAGGGCVQIDSIAPSCAGGKCMQLGAVEPSCAFGCEGNCAFDCPCKRCEFGECFDEMPFMPDWMKCDGGHCFNGECIQAQYCEVKFIKTLH